MPYNMIVEVYYGPASWFQKKRPSKFEALLDIVYKLDEESRRFIYRVEGREQPKNSDESVLSHKTVVAESSDYANLTEHSIMNFVEIVRRINPSKLILQNPPDRIYQQLDRVFKVNTERFEYPILEIDAIREFNRDYDKNVIGQPRVKSGLLAALYQLTRRRSVPVVLMLYGPSGVGKTETAKFINSLLSGTLMRKQFSMYHTDRFASYIFGGSHSEPSFAHDLLDREPGVILIDEFDKANPAFYGAFYQLFDEGVFEDKNYRLNMGSTLIICTSNYKSEADVRTALGDALCSRFDALIGYDKLTFDALKEISEHIVDKKIECLSDEEKQLLNAEQIKRMIIEKFLNIKDGNVRKIAKMSEQVISLILVRRMLE